MNIDLWNKINRNIEDIRRKRHCYEELSRMRMYYLGLLHGLKWNANADDWPEIVRLLEDFDSYPTLMVTRFDNDAVLAERRIEEETRNATY